MRPTSISWTEMASNPIHFVSREGKKGWLCSKVSHGCVNCYAEAINKRFGNGLDYNLTSVGRGEWQLYRKEIESWGKLDNPVKIFVCDMTDLFHDSVPDSFRDEIFAGMEVAPWHTYQVLTKRPEGILRYYGQKIEHGNWDFPNNIWLGVTIESPDYLYRLDALKRIPVSTRFVSFEPLLADINTVDLTDIAWIIVGAESGPNRRPFNLEWAYNLLNQAKRHGVKFFMKQNTALRPGSMDGIPEDLRIREFPVEV